ncbi:SGNH/GDSL hydrolase family protein [Novosphingobium taihuense]|uniref:Lysophospholipase L1-like esterase n=1 Tax=Novosphingobium taihuense TaxID=260085 RepID=A0A7W7AB02_9SPHN|nr:SGNH/GDSL hydrolase family protein [Novosphingobium taihuense]MBB4613690.1 lysophospholipase L1-like esterase [Novosphingobium taihuense]TWH83199.1 lysophospholipase L1-like esterase [Novosphingobium taihuense]
MGEVSMRPALFALAALLASPVLAKPAPLPEGARYVALGSSFAAGPGVGPNTPDTPQRCGRGTLNYPNLLAAKLKLTLTDATCSGATTKHVLGAWDEVPAQIESVTADARLVTITIGGNDVNFVGNIFAAACEKMATPDQRCQKWRAITEAEWKGDEERMRKIVREVRQRAPDARIVFVDYITVLPPKGACAAVPISDERMAYSRGVAKRLAKLTAKVARTEKAEVFRFSALSKTHAPCSAEPWSNGMSAPQGDGIPIHPNRAGHEAAAEGLAAFLN